jgi:hypothetical protein
MGLGLQWLRCSYDDFSNANLNILFLHCVVFLEDAVIDVVTLVEMCIV